MTVSLAYIQNRINEKVWTDTNLPQSIEVQTYTASSNSFGEEVETFSVQTIVKGVVLDYVKYKRSYDQQGQYKDSTCIVLLPYNTVVTDKDRLVFNSTTFRIINISQVAYGSGFTHLKLFVQKEN